MAKKTAKTEKAKTEKAKTEKAKTEKDPNAPKRSFTRLAVKCNGNIYPSAQNAFIELDLPLGKLISFRKKLKAEGKAEIDGFKFVLTELKPKTKK